MRQCLRHPVHHVTRMLLSARDELLCALIHSRFLGAFFRRGAFSGGVLSSVGSDPVVSYSRPMLDGELGYLLRRGALHRFLLHPHMYASSHSCDAMHNFRVLHTGGYVSYPNNE